MKIRTKKPSKILIACSDPKSEYFNSQSQYLTEKDSMKDASFLVPYIESMGIETRIIRANSSFIPGLLEYKPDMVINMVGSVRGSEKMAASVPAILDFLDIPCSGAGVEGEAMAYDKYMIKKLLDSEGIPVPAMQLFISPDDDVSPELEFPVIVKLNEIHGSVEITQKSVCKNISELKDRTAYLLKTYHSPIIAENFIFGEEYSCVGFEKNGIETYTAKNIFANRQNGEAFASFDMQWKDEEIGFEKYRDPSLDALLIKAFRTVKMRDYGKFDIRKGRNGKYYFLDANTNPAFGPKENECAMATVMDLFGISFAEILEQVISNTMSRNSS